MPKPTELSFGPYTVEVSNPDKSLFPSGGITKSDLIDYYRAAADVMLPQVKNRPLTMHRFPDGIDEEGFYQKEIGDYFPEWIRRAELPKEGGTIQYVVCHNRATLAYLANQAMITAHVWLSRIDAPRNPDRLTFDLDPPGDDFETVRFAARVLKGLLDELALPAFLQTTGSRGVHVVIPLDRSAGFDDVRQFARDLAGLLAGREPRRLTVEQRRNKRGDRVYLDTGRNAYGQTMVAPYSVRARAGAPVAMSSSSQSMGMATGAPVAMPIDWEELDDPRLHARSFNLTNARDRLTHDAAPWRFIGRRAVGLAKPRRRLEKLRSC